MTTKQIIFKTDAELHKKFKIACINNSVSMQDALNLIMQEWVAKQLKTKSKSL